MRSAHPSSRRCGRGPGRGLLPAVAGIVDRATAEEPGHVIVRIEGPVHPDVDLGLNDLGADVHPFDVLAGVTAPDSWTAFGVRAHGRAHHLDAPDAPLQPVAATFLVDRTGDEASVLRVGDVVTEPTGRAEGTIPDLARRVLGLPTAPAPASTAHLWTAMWLDRVLERWGQPERRRDLTSSWGQIAVLHPAIHAPSPADVIAFADPASLVTAARSHAAATQWAELRRSSLPLALPGGSLDRDVALWMDDGFFARWTVGAFAPASTLAGELGPLLGEPLGRSLVEVTAALLRGA